MASPHRPLDVRHGYQVVLATDAMTDRDRSAHDNSVEGIFPKLGETTTTEEVLQLVDRTP